MKSIDDTAKLFVAKPLMPDLSDLASLLKDVWGSQQVTNEGPLHNRLEEAIARHLNVPVSKLFSNGTTALQCALLALDLPKGSEVITTPLTFAATAHAITASGLKPVFADIDETTLTLDPAAVERAITSNTSAVLAVHVYGTICDHVALQQLCDAHGLKLIFDAAHAFGAFDGPTPVGMMGHMSVFSLHATKLYNTFEGGLITTRNVDWASNIRSARNFGIESEELVSRVGINGKMSELHAAIGILNLEIMASEVAARRDLRARYDQIIDNIPGLRKQIHQPNVIQSEQYYMILIDPETYGVDRNAIYNELIKNGIFSRRYFWPICTDFECYRGQSITTTQGVPVVERVKDHVLCLPFHSGVLPQHEDIIASVLYGLFKGTVRTTKVNEVANV